MFFFVQVEITFERKAVSHADSCLKNIKKNISQKKKIVKCTVESCCLEFGSKKFLLKHFRSDHSDLCRSFIYSVCSRSFNDISNYKKHVKTHRSLLEAECQMCQKKLFKYNVKRHIESYHGPVKVVTKIIEEMLVDAMKTNSSCRVTAQSCTTFPQSRSTMPQSHSPMHLSS